MTTVLGCHFRQIQLIDTSINMHKRNSYLTTRNYTYLYARISCMGLSQLIVDFPINFSNFYYIVAVFCLKQKQLFIV